VCLSRQNVATISSVNSGRAKRPDDIQRNSTPSRHLLYSLANCTSAYPCYSEMMLQPLGMQSNCSIYSTPDHSSYAREEPLELYSNSTGNVSSYLITNNPTSSSGTTSVEETDSEEDEQELAFATPSLSLANDVRQNTIDPEFNNRSHQFQPVVRDCKASASSSSHAIPLNTWTDEANSPSQPYQMHRFHRSSVTLVSDTQSSMHGHRAASMSQVMSRSTQQLHQTLGKAMYHVCNMISK
jgi:hypothetical protein